MQGGEHLFYFGQGFRESVFEFFQPVIKNADGPVIVLQRIGLAVVIVPVSSPRQVVGITADHDGWCRLYRDHPSKQDHGKVCQDLVVCHLAVVKLLVEHLYNRFGNEKAFAPTVHVNIVRDDAGSAARVIRTCPMFVSRTLAAVDRLRFLAALAPAGVCCGRC